MPRKYKAAEKFKKGDRLVISGNSLEITKVSKPVDYGSLNRKKVINIWVKGQARPHIYYVDTRLEYE